MLVSAIFQCEKFANKIGADVDIAIHKILHETSNYFQFLHNFW